MNTENEVQIPEEIQQMCRNICEAARKSGLDHLSGSFSADFTKSKWTQEVSFNWKMGRHGEESNRLSMSSTFRANTVITDNKKP